MENELTSNNVNSKKCTCLHCGCECEGKYCANCGQSTATARLTTGTFFSQSINGIFRINPVFLQTLWRLLVTPWVVISGYIKGHRICYTPPVVMLVLLVLFTTIIDSFIESTPINEISLYRLYNGFGFRGIYLFLVSIISLNKVLFCFFLIPPAAIAIRIAYRRNGAANYSWVEYAFAALYFVCSLVATTGLLLLIRFLFNVDIGIPLIIYAFVLFSITLWKAFPCRSVRELIGRFLLTILYGVAIYAIYIGFFCGLLYIILHITVEY